MTGSVAWTPPIGNSGLRGLVLRRWPLHESVYNTGSDLDIEKRQKASRCSTPASASTGRTTAGRSSSGRQNLFDKDFLQVAFDAPVQGGCTTRGAERFLRRLDLGPEPRDAALRRVPRRAADVRRDAAGEVGSRGRPRRPMSPRRRRRRRRHAAGDADLPGRLGDPGDRRLPGAAASASAAAPGAGTRQLETSEPRFGGALLFGG